MERTTSITEAKEIMGENFIGPLELENIADKMYIRIPTEIPMIPFGLEELRNKKIDYLLILGVSEMRNGKPVTLRSLRDHFGIDPDLSEPCFYNQDWYLSEQFIDKPLETKWFLIRKVIVNESRGRNPEDLIEKQEFPFAILCAYTFFTYWFHTCSALWEHDFIWCTDVDTNGDRIYVARYYDPSKKSKNGFSIHRHLRIQKNYGIL